MSNNESMDNIFVINVVGNKNEYNGIYIARRKESYSHVNL